MESNVNSSLESAGWVSALADLLEDRFEKVNFRRSGRYKFIRRNATKCDVLLFQSRTSRLSAAKIQVHVTPVVQANFHEVKKLVDAIRGPSHLPSIGGALGRFSPKGSLIEWTLQSNEDVKAVADDLWAAIAQWGMPLWETTSSVAATLQAVEQGRIADKPPYLEDIAVMVYLVRGADAAVQFVLSAASLDDQSRQKALSLFRSIGSMPPR